MLVFSLLYYQYYRITSSDSNKILLPLPQLVFIPSKLGPIYNCILIHECFFNQFHTIIHSSKSTITPPPNKKVTVRPRLFHPLSLHHILFLIYILINFTSVYIIHGYNLPLSSLSILPVLLISSAITHHHRASKSYIPTSTPPVSLPQWPFYGPSKTMLSKRLAIYCRVQLASNEIFRRSRSMYWHRR
jgi:hypothetical protein